MNPPDIYFKPSFIPHADQLFRELMTSIVWDERMRARKTASFGVAYNYSQISYAACAMPPLLAAVCIQIAAELAFHPNNCLINLYQDGNSSMGFHSDIVAGLAKNTGVAIISLGSLRELVFRNKLDRSEFAYPLPSGSLLYMSQEIQHDWVHAIPKTQKHGERISLTFRCFA